MDNINNRPNMSKPQTNPGQITHPQMNNQASQGSGMWTGNMAPGQEIWHLEQ